MYYTIYKIVNQIDGKVYIGSHKTKNLNDDYMGSGKYLKYAQEKHGIENFTKEILFVFDTPELMYAKEAELVNEEFLATENTYNLKVGGFGGFDYLNNPALFDNPTHSVEHMKRMSELSKPFVVRTNKEKFKNENYRLQFGENSTIRQKCEYVRGRVPAMLGKTHSVETKRKISTTNSLKQSGNKNSQFGTMWITNGLENAKIKKESVIPEGWKPGRKGNRL